MGGLGLGIYGEYCVVIDEEQSRKYQSLAFIKEESLHYVDDNELNFERLSQDLANRENVHVLAALKHENDIGNVAVDKWKSFFCRGDCYIETITTDNISSNHIGSVRIKKEIYDRYADYLYRDYLSELEPDEKHKLSGFIIMQNLLKELNITLEVMAE